MSKGKPRWYPDKPQNKYGSTCPMCEEIPQSDGTVHLHCECGGNQADIKVCKGNRHNCIKTKLHINASRSDIQKINDYKIY